MRRPHTLLPPALTQALFCGTTLLLRAHARSAMRRRGGGFYACSTNVFKLNYFETASGHRFVLTTDKDAGDMREHLRNIYSQIFVECMRWPSRTANDMCPCQIPRPTRLALVNAGAECSWAGKEGCCRLTAPAAWPLSLTAELLSCSHALITGLVKNPLWRPGEEITNAAFKEKLERYVSGL